MEPTGDNMTPHIPPTKEDDLLLALSKKIQERYGDDLSCSVIPGDEKPPILLVTSEVVIEGQPQQETILASCRGGEWKFEWGDFLGPDIGSADDLDGVADTIAVVLQARPRSRG